MLFRSSGLSNCFAVSCSLAEKSLYFEPTSIAHTRNLNIVLINIFILCVIPQYMADYVCLGTFFNGAIK